MAIKSSTPAPSSVIADKYKLSLSFRKDKDADVDQIDTQFIRYLVIENSYMDKAMPVIYLSIALKSDLYSKIYDSKNDPLSKNTNNGRFIFKLEKYNALSANPIYETLVNGTFSYIISSDNPDYSTELQNTNSGELDAYKTLTIALLSVDLMNALRSETDRSRGVLVSGIFKDIDTSTIIAKVFEGLDKYNLKPVIKPPIYNSIFGSKNITQSVNTMVANARAQGAKISDSDRDTLLKEMGAGKNSSLIIPPMTSRKQVLKYLFDKAPFYNTPFTFFLDFNRAYLIDQQGGYKVDNENDPHNVVVEINQATDQKAYVEGYVKEKDQYTIYVNPANAKITTNQLQDKVSNKLITIDEEANVDSVSIDVNSSYDSDDRFIFRRGGNIRLYKNILESNSVYIEIAKENMDSFVLTPNKRYHVTSYDKYKKYDGDYILEYKKEIILNNSGDLRSSCLFRLRRIGNIIDIGFTNGNTGVTEVRNSDNSKLDSRNAYNTQSGVASRNSNTTNLNNSKVSNGSSSQFIQVKSITSPSDGTGASKTKHKAANSKEVFAYTFDDFKAPTVEEEVEAAEAKKVKRISGTEVDDSSAGPVVRGTSKTINIYRTIPAY